MSAVCRWSLGCLVVAWLGCAGCSLVVGDLQIPAPPDASAADLAAELPRPPPDLGGGDLVVLVDLGAEAG